MSGHSKWSTIKRKKGATDAKRSKIFSRVVKEIMVAVKEGGPKPDTNSRLRLAIQNAKGANMPKDNILRAINKAEKDNTKLDEITFEGYAMDGIGLFIECLSDNNNRIVSKVRSVFNKKGGTLGTNGSLGFMFERKGIFTFRLNDSMSVDELELTLIDTGAEDIEIEDDTIIVTTTLEDFGTVSKRLEELKIDVMNAELQRIPLITKKLPIEKAKRVLEMIENFEELDDVQNVYHNLEMTNELQTVLEKK